MAIHYIDMENGINKPTLTNSAYAFSPDDTKVRIYSTTLIEHGLTTGEQVVLSAFTAWLNATWTVTVIDKYCFELQGATWQATADFLGTSTPVTPTANDGSSWALATKGNIPNATMDAVYVAKTPDPVSLAQQVIFTNKSKNLTLTTPVTQDIEQANVNNWTVVAPNTISVVATAGLKKLGAGVLQIAKNTAFTTPGKMAYKAMAATLDLSGFNKISFWFGSNGNYRAYSGGFKICLCSDALGDVPVNTFTIPPLAYYSQMQAMVCDNGAPLGNNINSVAIYMGNNLTGVLTLWINHIFACNAVTLQTLISKTNTIFSEQLAIQSIIGNTIVIDEGTFNSSRGYAGATETVTPYIRQPYYCVETITQQLLYHTPILFGINKASNLQDGETWLGWSRYINIGGASAYADEISNLGLVRITGASGGSYGKYKNIQVTGSNCLNAALGLAGYSFENIRVNHCSTQTSRQPLVTTGDLSPIGVSKNLFVMSCTGSSGIAVQINSNRCYFENLVISNNSHDGLVIAAGIVGNNEPVGNENYINGLNTVDNGNDDYEIYGAENTIVNFSGTFGRIYAKTYFINSPENTGPLSSNYGLHQFNIGGVKGANIAQIGVAGYIKWQTIIKQGNDPGAWLINVNNEFIPLAEIPVAKDVQITIRAWIKHNNQVENTNSKLIVRKRKSPNVLTEDVYTTLEVTHLWREVSITFTPIETGVVVLELNAGNSDNQEQHSMYVGSISMT